MRRPGPGPLRSPPQLRARRPLPALQRSGTAPCRCSCPKRPTPRPRPVSTPGPTHVRPRRTRSLWTSAAATGSWGWSTRPPRASAPRPRRLGPSTRHQRPKPFLVVAHVPLEDLVDQDAGDPSELAAELEHHGLIDLETVRRIACDATVVVAVDDELGHTMYEGRAKRFPTGAQRREVIRRDRPCRFPGVPNATFAAVHHIVPVEPRWRDRPGQSGALMPTSPRGGAPQRLVHDGQRQ